jgi:hypothetical protein
MRRVAWTLTLGVLAAGATAAGCRSDGRELRPPTQPLPATTTTSTVLPIRTDIEQLPSIETAPTRGRAAITIDRLFSPANATAEMSGTGAVATDPVTVDDQPADVRSFTVDADGRFVLRVWIEEEGPHTVCVADECGRVFTLAPDAEGPEQIVAKIERAEQEAVRYLDYPRLFPAWTVAIGPSVAGTGGSVDVITRTVTIYRNRDRSVDDFVRTILHEFGHVTDYEQLDDAERETYRQLSGFEPDTPWRSAESASVADWADQPSEDFAELMVTWWSDGRWTPRTRTAQPDAALIAAVAALSGLEPPLGLSG